MDNAMLYNPEEKIRVGTTLIRNLSTSFYPNTVMIFEELVTNARDAMAKNVEIRIGNDTIEVADDGEGMSPDELKKFFYISYSEKPLIPMRHKKDMRRQIIGRFGIGKLSIYQICKSFTIESKKDNVLSKASFDFEDFEKNTFVDDFNLNVITEQLPRKSGGTRIILSKLKAEKVPKTRDIVERLSKSMPINKDFRVAIHGNGLLQPHVLEATKLPGGSVHNIDTDKQEWSRFKREELGRITGSIVYKPTEKREGGDYGVFIRVLGRRINSDNPYGIINFSSLTHARQFARKIYADLNVDSLQDILLTNRAGIMQDNGKFRALQDFLKNILNHLNDEEYFKWKKAQYQEERNEVKTEVTGTVSDMLDGFDSGKTFPRPQIDVEDKPRISDPAMWEGNRKIIINSSHPIYSIAKKAGKIEGIKVYTLLMSSIEIALKMAKNLEDFRKIFYSMLAGEPARYTKKKGGNHTRTRPKVQ